MGICGGHQLMSAHFGAMVGPVTGEVWCETKTVERTPAGQDHWLFEAVPPQTPFQFGNYEHVATVPAQAHSLAIRGSSPAVALDYGGGWVSVQFHPEMTAHAMAVSWEKSHPERVERYFESHLAARLLLNFLHKAGLNATDVL
jgi:GMP synthase-like glutamine amidotransferase